MDEKSVSEFEAKTKLDHLLDRVQKGERITITRHGVPVAHLVSVQAHIGREKVARTIDALKGFRKEHAGEALSINELLGLVNDGRR